MASNIKKPALPESEPHWNEAGEKEVTGSGISASPIRPSIAGKNFIWLKCEDHSHYPKQLHQIQSLWSKIWMWSDEIQWIGGDPTGFTIRYKDTRYGDAVMAKLPEQCMSIGGWERINKQHMFKVNKRQI